MKIHEPLRKWSIFLGACGLGLFIVFLNRFTTGPDQDSYLDLAVNLARSSWFSNINGYWGTLMPALVALVFRLAHPSPAWELPAADVAVYFTFVFVLVAQLFFQARVSKLLEARFPERWTREKTEILGTFGLVLTFGITCGLAGMGVRNDLLVAALFLVASGCLAGFLRRAATVISVSAFALVLALGFLAKSIFFFLAFVFVFTFYLAQRGRPRRLFHTLLLAALFLGFSAVQWLPLSWAKGRLDFGDTGTINYVWIMAQGKYAISEDLQTSLDGTPLKHPFRILSQDPLIYGFGGDVGGTLPNWYDPSYYMDGLHVALRPVRQMVVVFLNLIALGGILSRGFDVLPGWADARLGILPGLLTFLSFATVVRFRRRMVRFDGWELIGPAAVGCLLYLLTSVSLRYVAAFLIVVLVTGTGWLLVEASPGRLPSMRRMVLALLTLTFLGVLAQGLNGLHDQLRQGGYHRLWDNPDVAEALALPALHVPEGTSVAEIGDAAPWYFPHVARLRILARVEDPSVFWSLPEDRKRQVYGTLAAAGMQDVIALAPPPKYPTPDWIPIGESPYLVRRLPAAAP